MLKLSIACVCVRMFTPTHISMHTVHILFIIPQYYIHDSKKTLQQPSNSIQQLWCFLCAQGTQHQNLPGCLAASSSDKQWTDGAKRRPPLHPAPSARPETTTNPQGTLKTMRDNETEWDSMRHNERRSAIGDRIVMTWISWVDVEGFKAQSCWVCSPSLSSRSHWMSQVHNTS